MHVYYVLTCDDVGEIYMKCIYFWCVIILSHVIAGYIDSRKDNGGQSGNWDGR